MILNCIIVDDELLQQEILTDYVNETEYLEVIGHFQDGVDVIPFLKENKVDVIFLDINMPLLNGIELIKRIADPPEVIFTTAYSEYAVEAFNLDVVDYLLKPISFNRFKQSIEKLKLRLNVTSKSDTFIVRVDRKDFKINYDDILYFEGCGDYVKLFTKEENLVFHSTLKQLEQSLPSDKFIRVHKSHIVSITHINYVEGNSLSIDGKLIPIGNSYRNAFSYAWGN